MTPRWFLKGLCAAGLAAAMVGPVFGQPTSGSDSVRISLEQGEGLARQLLRSGQPEAARAIASALLQADDQDSQAYVILAQSELMLGNQDAALSAARSAWRTAENKRRKFEAAFTMADILAAQESYTRSQIWVRRAIQNAPGPQSEQIAIAAFRNVRQANPLAIELSFGITPSDNVNSGNSNETITFAYLPGVLAEIEWSVPEEQLPLSGVELSLNTDFRYRISESATSQTSLEFGIYGRTYVMSDSARLTAPEVTGESLSYARASFGLLHQWRPEGAQSPYSASITYAHSWYGGSPYRHEIIGDIGTQFELSPTDMLDVSAGARYSYNIDSGVDVMTYSLRGRWSRKLENDDVAGLIGQLAHSTSDASDAAYTGITIGVTYDFGDIAPGVDLTTSYIDQYRVYQTSTLDPAGREDRITSLSVAVGFQNVDFYGFEPVLSLQGRRTDSTVPRYDTEGLLLGLNLRSSF